MSAFDPFRTLASQRCVADIRRLCDATTVLAFRFAAIGMFLGACSAPQDRQREQMMDQIEKQVRLPQGAEPLDKYVRYYAGPDRGNIAAIYILPGLDELPPGEVCEELKANMSSAPCSSQSPITAEVGPGNRIWVPDSSKLPVPLRDTGKCGMVSVVYMVGQRRVVEAACFGQDVSY